MGLLYVDEAGNSGLLDIDQPNFLYGGIYIDNSQWKNVFSEMNLLLENTKNTISSRVDTITMSLTALENIQNQLDFFNEFYFHAKEVIRGSSLWGKLNSSERFQIMSDIIDICKKNKVKIYIGILNKQYFLNNMTITKKNSNLMDYKLLIPYYFSELEKELVSEYVLVRAHGDIHESKLISQALFNTNKFFPDEFIIESKKSLMLQIADALLWIIQAHNKIDATKPTLTLKEHETNILYQKLLDLEEDFNLYNYRPIYL